MQSRSSHEKALSCVRALCTTSQLPSRAVVAVREPHLWLWRKAVPFNVTLRQTSSSQLHSADRLKVPRQKKKRFSLPLPSQLHWLHDGPTVHSQLLMKSLLLLSAHASSAPATASLLLVLKALPNPALGDASFWSLFFTKRESPVEGLV